MKITKLEYILCVLSAIGIFAIAQLAGYAIHCVATRVEIRWVESSSGKATNEAISPHWSRQVDAPSNPRPQF
jgi:hypothetical protein